MSSHKMEKESHRANTRNLSQRLMLLLLTTMRTSHSLCDMSDTHLHSTQQASSNYVMDIPTTATIPTLTFQEIEKTGKLTAPGNDQIT